MADRLESESRKLLGRLRDALAESSAGQDRLDRIVKLIAGSMQAEVCSIYLFRDAETLELCATEGLQPESVHQTRLRLGEGLVGRTAKSREVINTANAPAAVTAGTDSKNENRAAASRVRPSASPADMVIPLREVPGTRASACAKPMSKPSRRSICATLRRRRP
jgi:hypothetical protein